MMNQYLEISFSIQPVEPFSEILIAELSDLEFESFVQENDGIKAYIIVDKFDPDSFDQLAIFKNESVQIQHRQKVMPIENWNSKWEENFNPIVVNNQCTVRATFHQPSSTDYDIIIQPKMAFGTGHHETTYLMIQEILKIDFEGKTVLDMGCGTGILGILALMKSASMVKMIDIDDWAVENTKENLVLNEGIIIDQTFVEMGDVANLNNSEKFDVIFANINRNVLIDQMSSYYKHLETGGELLLSGILAEDAIIIQNHCEKLKLKLKSKSSKNNWLQFTFIK
jgi:ribosomal protein L11 methyltransferase